MGLLRIVSFALALVFSVGVVDALAQAPSGLVGRWQSPDSEVDIKGDGTMTINGTPYRYSIKGSIFTLIG